MFAFFKRTKKQPVLVPQREVPTAEVGSFAHGLCDDCDWRGPGRRARSLAQDDARTHSVTCGDSEATSRLSA